MEVVLVNNYHDCFIKGIAVALICISPSGIFRALVTYWSISDESTRHYHAL